MTDNVSLQKQDKQAKNKQTKSKVNQPTKQKSLSHDCYLNMQISLLMPVVLTFYCVKNYSKIWWLKITHIINSQIWGPEIWEWFSWVFLAWDVSFSS